MAADINKFQNQNDNNNNFGLPTAEFKPIESTGSNKWLKITIVIAGIVLFIGAGVIFWLLQHSPSTKSCFISNTLRKNQETESDDARSQTIASDETMSATESSTTDDNFIDKTDVDQQNLDKNKDESPIVILNAPTGLYYVVVASHIDIDLAMDYAQKIVQTGINVKLIVPNKGNHFVRLAIAQEKSFEEATRKAKELKAAYKEDIWVIKY